MKAIKDVLAAFGALLWALLVTAAQPLLKRVPGNARPVAIPAPTSSYFARLGWYARWEGSRNLGETGPATIIQAAPYEVADHIMTIRFDPDVLMIFLKVYWGAAKVTREIIVKEPELRGRIGGHRRLELPPVPYTRGASLREVAKATEAEASALISRLAAEKAASRSKKAKSGKPATSAETAPPAGNTAPTQPQPVLASAPPTANAPVDPAHIASSRGKVFAPKVVENTTYVGRVIEARSEQVRKPNQTPYEIYVVRLQLDSGALLPLRGAELQREMDRAGVRVGDRVAITPTGRVPVDLANGSTGAKNLYTVVKEG